MLSIQKFTFSPMGENTYIVYNQHKTAAIIDPGCYTDDEKETLTNWIAKENLTVKYLLCTHCHLDHVFGAKYVADTYQLLLHCHPNEEQLLAYAPVSGLNYGLPFDNYNGTIKYIDTTNIITLDEDELHILFTPGHSPGSISFYAKNEGFVVSGDVLFYESIGRTDLPMGNHQQLLSTILTQLYTLPASVKVYSGHGQPTTIGYEMQHNPFIKA